MTNVMEEFVSLPEAARELGISRATAYTRALAGKIPAQMIAGRYAVRLSDLEDLKRQRHPGQSARMEG